MLNISFKEKDLYQNEAIVVLINNQLQINNEVMEIDQKYHGLISKIIQNANKFKGKLGQALKLVATDKVRNFKNIIIIGLGDETKIQSYQLEEVGGTIYSKAKQVKASSVGIIVNSRIGGVSENNVASLLGSGAMLASYKFDKYLTKKRSEERFDTKNFNIIVNDEESAYDVFEKQKAVVIGVYFARDLVSEPPNVLYPESYAEQIVDKLEPLGINIDVIGEREMYNLGMGALLGVGQGSSNESKLVVMKYEGGTKNQKPVCFVGKGVTFDTGGISLKPSTNMADMKSDMGGSASVVGVMKALALRSSKANVVGVVGLVENMPGGNAQRPGDIITTMSGQTVEVLNTDAEGRLVLCDCITYLQENFEPDCVIDLATLTGTILISLASTYGGCFANDDNLAKNLINTSIKTNEKLWRMPLHKDFDEMLKSSVADVANIGNSGGKAGSSTAAHFIGRFIKDGIKWGHLDIAGMAWDKSGKNPICPKGAVGFGVRLLNQFVWDYYESQ